MKKYKLWHDCAGYGNIGITCNIGSFDVKQGKNYSIDADVILDKTVFDNCDPHFYVQVHPQAYENALGFMLYALLAMAILCVSGFVLIVKDVILHYKTKRNKRK